MKNLHTTSKRFLTMLVNFYNKVNIQYFITNEIELNQTATLK